VGIPEYGTATESGAAESGCTVEYGSAKHAVGAELGVAEPCICIECCPDKYGTSFECDIIERSVFGKFSATEICVFGKACLSKGNEAELGRPAVILYCVEDLREKGGVNRSAGGIKGSTWMQSCERMIKLLIINMSQAGIEAVDTPASTQLPALDMVAGRPRNDERMLSRFVLEHCLFIRHAYRVAPSDLLGTS
jgi:hypothetical protein